MTWVEPPYAPFDSTIGAYILTAGNTHALWARYDSPAYPEDLLDSGWTWFLNTWAPCPTFAMDNIALYADYLINVVMPPSVTFINPLPGV